MWDYIDKSALRGMAKGRFATQNVAFAVLLMCPRSKVDITLATKYFTLLHSALWWVFIPFVILYSLDNDYRYISYRGT